ncbi:MAG: PIN domain-containing protein [Candidatus Lokiarchaeota archaeon]|nr:PIN domain-containing protein [Candidatus Harpocratesius repetitus]
MGELVQFLLNHEKCQCFTPSIVIAELSDKFNRENKQEKWKILLKFINNKTEIVNLDIKLADQAGKIKIDLRKMQQSRTQKLGLADAIIYQTAVHKEAKLISGDEHFKDFSGVIYLKSKKRREMEIQRLSPIK